MEETKRPINWRPYLYRYIVPLVVITGILMAWTWERPELADPYPMEVMEGRVAYRFRGSYNRDFNDLNDIQLKAAKKKGITPAQTRNELEHKKGLVELQSNDHYKIMELTHSVPYVIPEMAQLLEEIGSSFVGVLSEDQLPLYRPVITSVTRTEEDVRKLRRGNGNASENSTHRYGTTVDISWKRFDKVDPNDPRDLSEEELKHLLAMVLKRYHNQERCYIKHERQQACFHITVR